MTAESIYKLSDGSKQLEIYYDETRNDIPYFDWDWEIKANLYIGKIYHKNINIYDNREKARKEIPENCIYHEFSINSCNSYIEGFIYTDNKELTIEDLKNIVKTLKEYNNGEVYGFKLFDLNLEITCKFPGVDKNRFLINSCWGYYGDSGIEQILEEQKEEGKTWIRQQ
jgi:hypothetical protein